MADMVFSGVTFSGGFAITAPPPSYKAIFGYGSTVTNLYVSITNLVSDTGVVATDTAGVGTVRANPAAAGYGADKAIFGYGSVNNGSATVTAITNLVSNTGVVSSDTTGVGTARQELSTSSYSR